MTPFDHYLFGIFTGLVISWLAFCVYLDLRGKWDRFLFLRWAQKARYWIGY